MQVESIRFDRVFDVSTLSGEFSFERAGHCTYGVRLPGGMIPGDGDVYLLAFDQPGDFGTVAGWRDPHTGVIGIDNASRWALAGQAELANLVMIAVLGTGLSLLGKAGLIGAALGLPVWYAARMILRRRAIRLALGDAAPALPALQM